MRGTYLRTISAWLLSTAPVFAHHSLSMYSRSTSLTVDGVVETYRWSNPHVRIIVKTLTPEGDFKQWDIESGSVGTLSSAGFSSTTLAVGDKVSISFYPRKDGGPSGFLISVVTPDGRKFEATHKGRSEGKTQFSF